MSQVELVNISKSYDKQKDVLDGINVSIEEGEFFVLVGPSGSGKSTLLRMIAGLEDITGGILKINDNTVNHLAPKEQLQATKSTAATQGALMDMLPQGRKVMETALESVYNGGDVDEAYNTAVDQFNRAIEQANRARGK